MSVPIPVPDPARNDEAVPARQLQEGAAAVGVCLAVTAGTALLGVVAGFVWAATAARPELVMTSPGAAGLVNPETSAFIAADATYCIICLAGGVISGVLGYLFGVRRSGPLGMIGVFAGAIAAAFIARWIGEQSGLATFRHLLATLPAGAQFRDSLTLGASGALWFWPLAACLVAGGLVMFGPGSRPRGRHDPRTVPGRSAAVRDADAPPEAGASSIDLAGAVTD